MHKKELFWVQHKTTKEKRRVFGVMAARTLGPGEIPKGAGVLLFSDELGWYWSPISSFTPIEETDPLEQGI